MKSTRALLCCLFLFSIHGLANAESYVIDAEGQHAFVTFKASHLGYSYVLGRFNDFEGTFEYDPANPAAATVDIVIDAASVDTDHAERDKHLRSSDFLEVDKYPEISFSTNAFEEQGENAVLKGDLTMHGVTQPIEIAVRHVGAGDDPWGGYRRGFEGQVTLAPQDFGLPETVGDLDIYLVIEGLRQ